MEPWAFEQLRADPEVAHRRAAFFESYAEHPTEMFARAPNNWLKVGTTATALRFAAQFATVVDIQWVKTLINKSATHYVDLGLPYGYFLYACFLEKPDAVGTLIAGPAVHWLRTLVSHSLLDQRVSPERLDHVALTYPVQQTYLYLAMVALDDVWMEHRDELGILSESLSAHATQPIGPQSAPLRTYLRIGQLIERIRSHDPQSRIEVVTELATLGRRYEASIIAAQENQHLWTRMQSPIDIVDLEIAGLTAVVDSALMEANLNGLTLQEMQLSRIARIPISIGLELHR